MVRLFVTASLASFLLTGCERAEAPAGAAPPAPSAPPLTGATSPSPAAPPTVQPGAPVEQVPAQFRGEWNGELAACGTGLHDSSLVLSARQVRFYESSGPVLRVEQPEVDTVAITASLSGEGEGPAVATHTFRLSADGSTLTTVGEGAPYMRHRCPAS